MNLAEAEMKLGMGTAKAVARKAWPETLYLCVPPGYSGKGVIVHCTDGKYYPYSPSLEELNAKDWVEVEP